MPYLINELWALADSPLWMQVLNLTIECTDRPGLLAEIAQIIADFGHNIKVCSFVRR